MSKAKWKLSASFIQSFKSCPQRCRLGYVIGLRRQEDTDALRVGSSWHKILEIANMKPASVCPVCANLGKKDPSCVLCEGTDILPDDMMDAVIRHLNKAYEIRPDYKTEEEWSTERIKLLYSLVGYLWYWQEQDQEYEVLHQEIRFSIPLRNPATDRALPRVNVVGMIDKILNHLSTGKEFVMEHKSTSKSVEADSTYWNRLALDTQTTLYPHAARESDLGDLGVLYDVWHKPTIKPKKLTQAESKQFIEDGLYCGEQFRVKWVMDNVDLEINSTLAEYEPGKKEGTFAIRETPEMFGARLLVDITERPEFYFARREIARTEADLKRFQWELYNIYQTVKAMDKNNGWFCNEAQCEATFKCEYLDICYNNVPIVDGMEREGFKNIFKEKKDEARK